MDTFPGVVGWISISCCGSHAIHLMMHRGRWRQSELITVYPHGQGLRRFQTSLSCSTRNAAVWPVEGRWSRQNWIRTTRRAAPLSASHASGVTGRTPWRSPTVTNDKIRACRPSWHRKALNVVRRSASCQTRPHGRNGAAHARRAGRRHRARKQPRILACGDSSRAHGLQRESHVVWHVSRRFPLLEQHALRRRPQAAGGVVSIERSRLTIAA